MKFELDEQFSLREACLIAIASFMTGVVVSNWLHSKRRPPMPSCPPPMPPHHPREPRNNE